MNIEQMYARFHEALGEARSVGLEIKRATGVDVLANLDLDPNPDAIVVTQTSEYVDVGGIKVAIEYDTGFFRFESIDKRAGVLRKHGASMLPNRFMIDPNRINLSKDVQGYEQAVLNVGFARFFLGMLGGLKPGHFAAAALYTDDFGLRSGQKQRGQNIPNTGAFAGDLIIEGNTRWKGPSLREAEAAINAEYDKYDV